MEMSELFGEKKLGFGLMRLPLTNPKDDTSIDIELAKKMVDVFMERGFTYFDTAWMYHDYQVGASLHRVKEPRHTAVRMAECIVQQVHHSYPVCVQHPLLPLSVGGCIRPQAILR